MDRNEITNKLTEIFRDVFSDATLVATDEMTSDDVQKWDSLSHMQLITVIEKQFGIKFKLKEILSWQNVGTMINCIEKKL